MAETNGRYDFQMRALIVEDGYSRGALAATRALGRAGWGVGIGAPRRGLAASSRWATYAHDIPAPYDDRERFVDLINRATVSLGYDVVFGAGDAEILTVSEARDELKVRVPYPPHDIVLRAQDKLELTRAATRVGLATPETVEVANDAVALEPPLVVKARLHCPPGSKGGGGRMEAAVVHDQRDARRRIDRIRALGGTPIVQRYIPGRLMALVVLRDNEGKLLTCVQQRADLTWPAIAGISVRAQTTPVDDRLRDAAAALLDELSWCGLAELQFVKTDDDAFLIDLNGRFYGSLALALASGPDVATVWGALTADAPTETLAEPLPGVRYQWLEGDLRRAFEERRGGLAHDVFDCLRYARGARHSIWDPDDRWPGIRYAFELGWRGIRKALT